MQTTKSVLGTRVPKHIGVSAVEVSQNSKVGTVSATYAAQQTCPADCPFYNSGCYAEQGNVGFQTKRLNAAASELDAVQLAKNEAIAIRTLSGKLPLRLHVVGDCTTNKIAAIVSNAADEHRAKHDQPVWSYTHAWRKVARKSWGKVAILASCETTKDAKRAMAKGYAAAIVVTEHKDTKAYIEDGIKLIPCPQQTGRTASCETCKLCFHDDRLRAINGVIAFEGHGATKKIANALVQIGAN